MPDAEQNSFVDQAAIYAVSAQMLRRNDWQLLEAADLTQHLRAPP